MPSSIIYSSWRSNPLKRQFPLFCSRHEFINVHLLPPSCTARNVWILIKEITVRFSFTWDIYYRCAATEWINQKTVSRRGDFLFMIAMPSKATSFLFRLELPVFLFKAYNIYSRKPFYFKLTMLHFIQCN